MKQKLLLLTIISLFFASLWPTLPDSFRNDGRDWVDERRAWVNEQILTPDEAITNSIEQISFKD